MFGIYILKVELTEFKNGFDIKGKGDKPVSFISVLSNRWMEIWESMILCGVCML